jgi:hypothetical protein
MKSGQETQRMAKKMFTSNEKIHLPLLEEDVHTQEESHSDQGSKGLGII